MITDAPGRGKKQCTSCQKYIGVRNLVCPSCQASFEPAKIKKKLSGEAKTSFLKMTQPDPRPAPNRPVVQVPVSLPDYTQRIVIPAGKCPVKLDGLEPEDIGDWIARLQKAGALRREHYTEEAICYYAREYADVFTPEYRNLCDLIRQVMSPPDVQAL